MSFFQTIPIEIAFFQRLALRKRFEKRLLLHFTSTRAEGKGAHYHQHHQTLCDTFEWQIGAMQ